MSDIRSTAYTMVSGGRGILAADESVTTMSARLVATGIPATEEMRRSYREMLVSTPGLCDGVSGVILCAETFGQRLSDGRLFPDALADLGMLAGIKVDTGTTPLAGCPGEVVTEGLDGLRERLATFAAGGAAFAKWRAVIRMGEGTPTIPAIRANAQALARYAALCQEVGLMPIVEPEVLYDGVHPMSACASLTLVVLLEVFSELALLKVDPAGMVLKPSMVLPGRDGPASATPAEVAAATMQTLAAVVPAEVAGIAFLSGGQAPDMATANLAAIRRLPAPWPVTFSFGRALVEPALAAWAGRPERVDAGQAALAERVAGTVAAVREPELAHDPQ
jgi:fructose-bisphosphate aldolase class I